MRSSALVVVAFALAVGAWFIWPPAGHSFFEYLGWMGSAAAAVFAAVSARATLATVQEMRLARQQEQRPQLTLDPGTTTFSFCWPDLSSAADDKMQARFERHIGDPPVASAGMPNFVLANFGGGAALDIEVRFAVAHDDVRLKIPPHYKEIPFGSENTIGRGRSSKPGDSADLYLTRPRVFQSSPVDSTDKAFRSHCGPGGTCEFEISDSLCWYLALRAMHEARPRRGNPIGHPSFVLTVEARYRSAVESSLVEVFAFDAQVAIWPYAANGSPKEVWKDISPPELRVVLAFVPKPRPAPAAITDGTAL
jgi:hypothetical protein